MEDFSKKFDVPANNPSEEDLRMWPNATFVERGRRPRRTRPDLPVLPDESRKIPVKEIIKVFNDFSDEILTEGALGKVYKVKQRQRVQQDMFYHNQYLNFINLALRRFDNMRGQGDELQREISMIRRLQNKNIASVYGVCDENNEQIIIYEQAFHGTLYQHLSDPTLTWPQRLQICLGVANGLNYIHYDIIHCDINSSKIFLDVDWEPKIYGFELSTEYPQNWMHSVRFSHHFGTNNITPKYDVYCFGVLLLEVLCGKKQVITDSVAKAELDKINGLNSWEQMDKQSLSQFKNLVYKCLNQQPEHRPNMDQIVKELDEMLLELQWTYEKEYPLAADDNNLKMDLLKIPLSEIKFATNNFNEEYYVGQGAYGTVYKANLDVLDIQDLSSMKGKSKDELPKINKTVAIKRIINRDDDQGKQGFLTEIELLTRCKHSNVVSLLGFCREAHEMILVYEYIFKGSLSDYLGSNRVLNLSWVQRIQICLDIANGINYLHTKMDGKPRIIHRDIKSDNILLDEYLNAKIADFGLSKLHDVKQQASTIYTKNHAGTPFYMDPEYLDKNKYKRESDTYSFGVVLFEVLSGRAAYDQVYVSENEDGIAPVARRRFNEGTLKELIDPGMIEQDDDRILILNRRPNQESFDTFSKIAYQCLAETQVKRPTMEVVIKELQNALNMQGETMVLWRFRFNDIELATKKFAETYRIGFDTNSTVYKAELCHFGDNSLLATGRKKNGEPSQKQHITVAIKCITGRKHTFFAELEMRTRFKHPNIVSPLGFCDERDEMIIVYEHASKRSLRYCLTSTDNGLKFLTWSQRLHMCLEIARGLDHIHTKMDKHHGDINSANILLNIDGRAKIGYFGIFDQTNHDIDMKVYWDPERKMRGELRTKSSDIYSFGVVLFEFLSGRLAYHQPYIENKKELAYVARECIDNDAIGKITDPSLYEETDDDVFTSNKVPNEDSLKTFFRIAYHCLGEPADRPRMGIVIKELDIALDSQIKQEKRVEAPEISSIYSRGILIDEGKMWCFLGSNGERNEMVSASQLSYEHHLSHKWCSIPESRFDKIAEMLDISNLNIQIKIRSQFLSPEVNYGVHLVFKFRSVTKSKAKQVYVNLTYEMGDETLHAYFATWREDEWMTIELYRFLNSKGLDTSDFEFLLKSFSEYYCGNRTIYVEGVEFRAIDNASFTKHQENSLTEVQQVNIDPIQQMQINDIFRVKRLTKFTPWKKNYHRLSASAKLCDSSNARLYDMKLSNEFGYQKVAELLSTQVFRIKLKIKSKMLSENTEYGCYLVFKLSEQESGLHCPVMVQDEKQQKNGQSKIVYFRSPRPWNINAFTHVPEERKDGWMEVFVWNFNTNHDKLQDDSISMNLEFAIFEGTMSGIIICDVEFRRCNRRQLFV